MNGEVLRRAVDAGDVEGLAGLLADRPELAVARLSWAGNDDDLPQYYVCHARFHGLAGHDRAAELMGVLLAAGAPVDGPVGCDETPLITAASYGEPEVARVLVAAGAELEATGHAVPGATALGHAVHFGQTAVVDLLVSAGARVGSPWEAAGGGDAGPALASGPQERAQALRAAAVNERLEVVDRLLTAGTPVDVEVHGATVLHWAAWEGRPRAVAHLLARGADPTRRDPAHGGTPLDWSRHRGAEVGTGADREAAERTLTSAEESAGRP